MSSTSRPPTTPQINITTSSRGRGRGRGRSSSTRGRGRLTYPPANPIPPTAPLVPAIPIAPIAPTISSGLTLSGSASVGSMGSVGTTRPVELTSIITSSVTVQRPPSHTAKSNLIPPAPYVPHVPAAPLTPTREPFFERDRGYERVGQAGQAEQVGHVRAPDPVVSDRLIGGLDMDVDNDSDLDLDPDIRAIMEVSRNEYAAMLSEREERREVQGMLRKIVIPVKRFVKLTEKTTKAKDAAIVAADGEEKETESERKAREDFLLHQRLQLNVEQFIEQGDEAFYLRFTPDRMQRELFFEYMERLIPAQEDRDKIRKFVK